MKSLAIATTGGDAPGMNAAIRAAVRKAISENLKVIGFERGYAGLLAKESKILDARRVGGIIHLGGTILRTSRAEEMRTEAGISKAAQILKENCVDGLIVIGGNGSFRVASKLH
jgi:6-phosphofructokinase 1